MNFRAFTFAAVSASVCAPAVFAANAYIKHHKIDKTPRFDIIGIVVDAENKEILYRNHLENVFVPQMRTTYSNSFSGSWKWQHRGKTIGRKR